MSYHRKKHQAKLTSKLQEYRAPIILPKSVTNNDDVKTNAADEKPVPRVSPSHPAEHELTPLRLPIDILPGIPHRDVPEFAAAAEFRESMEARS